MLEKKTYLTEETQQIHHIFKLLGHSQTNNKKKKEQSTKEPYGNHNDNKGETINRLLSRNHQGY